MKIMLRLRPHRNRIKNEKKQKYVYMKKNNLFRSFFKSCLFLIFILQCIFSSFSPISKETNKTLDKKDGFVDLFDGKTLKGWTGDINYWRVENGVLIGETTLTTPELKNNTFLIWQGGELGDFELITEYRISLQGNSGINYRSEKVKNIPFALKGYQADIDGMNNYTGQNYEERKRTTLAYRGEEVSIPDKQGSVENNAWTARIVTKSIGDSDLLKKHIKSEEWNQCRLVVKGNRMQHYINDVLMSDVIDRDSANSKLEGMLGIQIHLGPPMKVEYKNFRIKRL